MEALQNTFFRGLIIAVQITFRLFFTCQDLTIDSNSRRLNTLPCRQRGGHLQGRIYSAHLDRSNKFDPAVFPTCSLEKVELERDCPVSGIDDLK